MTIPDDELEEMRVRMFKDAQDKSPLPKHLVAMRDAGSPHVTITDTKTGNCTVCYLFNFKMISGHLADLHGENDNDRET